MPDGTIDRRGLLAVAGATAAVAVTGATGMTADAADARTIYAQVEADLGWVVHHFETVSLREVVGRLVTLEQLTRRTPELHRPAGRHANDWMHLRARVLAVLAQAEVGRGNYRTAGGHATVAGKLADASGDQPLLGRALAVNSACYSGQGDHPAAKYLAALAVRHGGETALGAQATAWAAWTHAADGDRAGVERMLRRGARILEARPRVWGRPGTSLDSYHPADMALASAKALMSVGLPEPARHYLDRAEEQVTPDQPAVYASMRITGAEQAIHRRDGDPSEAEALATEAVALSRDRQSAWVVEHLRALARQARLRYGRDLDHLVAAVETA